MPGCGSIGRCNQGERLSDALVPRLTSIRGVVRQDTGEIGLTLRMDNGQTGHCVCSPEELEVHVATLLSVLGRAADARRLRPPVHIVEEAEALPNAQGAIITRLRIRGPLWLNLLWPPRTMERVFGGLLEQHVKRTRKVN
jgi:hypothetical protein